MPLPLAKNHSTRWLLFVSCVILGTFVGIFFQHFETTAPLFRDIVNPAIRLDEINLLALKFAFSFELRMNLGTFFGGIAGLFMVK